MRRSFLVVLVSLALLPLAAASVDAGATLVGVAALPDGSGQWTTDAAGNVHNLGSAPFYGSTAGVPLQRPIVGIAATVSGRGYWLVASDGGIFSFGDARFFGSTGAIRLNQPIVGMAPTPSGDGYWLVASDGGIFSFGDARFFGSTGAIRLNQPITGMAPTRSGNGYWLVARDGGMFTFGDATFQGSGAATDPGATFAGMASASPGYWLATSTGKLVAFGGAADLGRASDAVVAVAVDADGLVTAHTDGHVEVHRPSGGINVPVSLPTRTAWLWPFASTSPWNTPIGELARYESPTDAASASLTRADVPAWVNAGQYSHPIYKAGIGDPMLTFQWSGHPDVVIAGPLSVRPAAGTDAHLHIVDASGRWVDEFFAVGGLAPLLTTRYHVRSDLLGAGVGTGGTRAYGGSAIGGLIRSWEVQVGSVPHALAIAIEGEQLARGPVWPATSEDANAPSTYSGAVHMGSLSALPPDVNIDALHLSREGQMVAHALQDYGGYIVDQSGCFCLYAEPSLDGTAALTNMRHDLAVLRPLLRVIANNSQLTVGGGGPPRRPPAPAPDASASEIVG